LGGCNDFAAVAGVVEGAEEVEASLVVADENIAAGVTVGTGPTKEEDR